MRFKLPVIIGVLSFLILGGYGVSSYLTKINLKFGVAAYKFHRYSQAEKYFREALFLPSPFSARAYLELGRSLLGQGEYDEAIKNFNKASSLGLGAVIFHSNLGRAFFETKDYPNAEKEYREALRLDANNAIANSWLSLLIQEEKGNETEAIKFAVKATETDPGDIELWVSLSNTYSNYGKYDQALEAAEKALKLRPNDCQALNSKALALALSGKYGDALEITAKIIENKSTEVIKLPDCVAQSYFIKGEVLELQKRTSEAISSYGEAMTVKDAWNDENLRKIQEKAKQRINFLKNK